MFVETEKAPKKSKSKDHGESKKKKKQKDKKEKHENLVKQLPASTISCPTHPLELLRIISRSSKNPPTCKSCGFKLSGKYGYYTCPKSANCFNLCSSCKVCTQSHMLRQVVSLKQFKNNPLYSENKYTCHGCSLNKQVDKRGVWHCGPCGFSMCPECTARNEALWENLNVEETHGQQ